MARLIPSWGSKSAKIILIGEAPGKWEHVQGAPFVGPSYQQKLKPWWEWAGLQRSDFFITNVYPYWPGEGNDIKKIDSALLERHAAELHGNLAQLTDPWLIVPTGNYALRALMAKPLRGGKGMPETSLPKITDWRGSITSYTDRNGRKIKVIPTIHPAATFRQDKYTKLCIYDWEKIAQDLKFRALRLPRREHLVFPSKSQVNEFEALIAASPPDAIMAVDIETDPKAGKLLCIAFSITPEFSITLGWKEWRNTIKRICETKIQKSLQNGFYDQYWLADEGVQLRNWLWDTLGLHHAIDATLPHDLATQGSLYTRQAFWKRDHKDQDKITQFRGPTESLHRYNGIDACVTRELTGIYLASQIGARGIPTKPKNFERGIHQWGSTTQPGALKEVRRMIREAISLGLPQSSGLSLD